MSSLLHRLAARARAPERSLAPPTVPVFTPGGLEELAVEVPAARPRSSHMNPPGLRAVTSVANPSVVTSPPPALAPASVHGLSEHTPQAAAPAAPTPPRVGDSPPAPTLLSETVIRTEATRIERHVESRRVEEHLVERVERSPSPTSRPIPAPRAQLVALPAPPPPRSEVAAPAPVEVTIGEITVRAVRPAAPTPRPRPAQPAAPRLSLSAYLARKR